MNFDRGFIEKVLTRGVDRLPCLEEAEVNPKRAWAGLYEMTPDHHPVMGPVKEVPGFFLANGFSGHGVMHSPATGRIVADLILHGPTAIWWTRSCWASTVSPPAGCCTSPWFCNSKNISAEARVR